MPRYVWSMLVECPGCGYYEVVSTETVTRFVAPNSATRGSITVTCPECNRQFEVSYA